MNRPSRRGRTDFRLGNGTTNTVEMTATLRLRVVHGDVRIAVDWLAYEAEARPESH